MGIRYRDEIADIKLYRDGSMAGSSTNSGTGAAPHYEPDTGYCVYGKVTYKDTPIYRLTVTLANPDGSSVTNVQTDAQGYYVIDSRALKSGKYWISALKMVGPAPRWASDEDLMDPGSARPDHFRPLTVSLPVSATGEEINIECLPRKAIFPPGTL